MNSPFTLNFVADLEANKAYVMGNAGASEVLLIKNLNGTSFIEITGSGNVMTTSVTTLGEAAHSRNTIMIEKLLPSQFYGSCSMQ